MLCSAWSISYEEPREVSNFPTIFHICRRVFQRLSFLLKDKTHQESPGDIFIRMPDLPAIPRVHGNRWRTILLILYLCINTSLYRIFVSRTNVGQFFDSAINRSSEISPIVSRRAISPTPLMKIAKVQNRYSNYPNKKD